MTAPPKFMSGSVVLGRDHWCHSNRLGMGVRLTPNLGGSDEAEWGRNSKILKFFPKKKSYKIN